jgi:Tol biopolymer transport system component
VSRTLQPEDVISHYRIVGPLGAGGMGEVYLAQDQTLERSVALKILPPGVVKDEERLRRFVLEAKSASSLSHPHIVTIYEIGQDQVRSKGSSGETSDGSGAVHFISMELISGETLTSKIHQEKADLRTLLGWLAQAAEGLAKAHAAGIVHRDLKPGNIMVTKDGYAKVLDFGLAKLTEKREADPDLTSATTELKDRTNEGVVLGTIGYMSPEQVRGKAVDHRSDIFSFGCVLYEAATRRRPFTAETNVETMHKILNEKPAPVEEIDPQVPAEVRRLIRRCLAKSVEQRLQSMKDLAIELREIVEEYETLSASSGSGGSTTSAVPAAPPAKSRAIVAGVAVAALVTLAGIAFGIYGLRRGRAVPSAGEAPSPSMKVTSLLSEPDVQVAILSGDGRYLAYTLEREGRWSLRVRQVATGGDVEILKPQDLPIGGLTFSPDGDYLFYQGRDTENPQYGALLQVPSLGGSPKRRGFDVDSAVSFSPDGKRVCFRRGAPQNKEDLLVILDLDTGAERVLARLSLPDQFQGHPSWSPDGLHIVAGAQRFDKGVKAEIAVFDPESGRQERLGDGRLPQITDISWLPDGSGLIFPASDFGGWSHVWLVSYPEGRARRLTNDQSDYESLSVSKDAGSLAALRHSRTANLWAVPATGPAQIRQITRGGGAESAIRDVDVAMDGTIFFLANSGDSQALFRIGADGANRQAISSGSGAVFRYDLLPGGGVVYDQIGEDLLAHIWRTSQGGEGVKRLTDGAGELLQGISPDGSRFLFGRADLIGQLWSMPAEGGQPTRTAEDAGGLGAQFSPDGKLIRYLTFRKIGDLFRNVSVFLPAAGGPVAASLVLPPRARIEQWAPDSKAMTFVLEVNQVQNVYRAPVDGGEPAAITHFKEGRILGYQWSRDGSRLWMCREIGSVQNLWVTPAGGGEPMQVTDFKTGVIFQAAWTPDSREIVFTYGEKIQDVVLIRDFR